MNKQLEESACMELVAGIGLMHYLAEVEWMAKNFIWIVVKENCDAKRVLQDWLHAYHHQKV